MKAVKPTVQQIIRKIKENPNFVFYQDIYTSMGFSSSSFYRWFPVDGMSRKQIDEALEVNRTIAKQIIRDKLLDSKNTAALIALYRLLGTQEERNILNQYKVDEIEAKKNENNIELVIN